MCRFDLSAMVFGLNAACPNITVLIPMNRTRLKSGSIYAVIIFEVNSSFFRLPVRHIFSNCTSARLRAESAIKICKGNLNKNIMVFYIFLEIVSIRNFLTQNIVHGSTPYLSNTQQPPLRLNCKF